MFKMTGSVVSTLAGVYLLLQAGGLAFASEIPLVLESKPGEARVYLQNAAKKLPQLKSLLADSSVQEIHLVHASAQQVSATTRLISLRMPDGRSVNFQLHKFVQEKLPEMGEQEGDSVRIPSLRAASYWIGDVPSDRKLKFPSPAEVDMDPLNQIFLVRREDSLSGEILLEGERYELGQVEGDVHALIRRKAPLDSLCGLLVPDGASSLEKSVALPSMENSVVIRVGLLMSEEAAAISHWDGVTTAERMVDTLAFANSVFEQSRVSIAFEVSLLRVVKIVNDKPPVSYADVAVALREIRSPDTVAGETIRKLRDASGTDMVLFATANYWQARKTYLAANRKETAFVMWDWRTSNIVNLTCIGTMFGLGSGYRGDPPGLPKYVHAYVAPDGNTYFRTSLMYGYNQAPCVGQSGGTFCTGVNLFSNPRIKYMGKPFGTFIQSDAARRLYEQGRVISNFYP